MNTRRGFLGVIAGAAAAMTLDPERLLWRPGAKTISIPTAPFVREAVRVRVVRFYDHRRCAFVTRIDAWYGFGEIKCASLEFAVPDTALA